MTLVDVPVESEEIEKDKPVQKDSSRLVVWLVVISFSLLFLPLYLISMTIQDDTQSMTVTLESVYSALTATPVANPEEVDLRNQYVELQKASHELDNLSQNLSANHINWPDVMARIRGYDAYKIKLNSIVQSAHEVAIIGEANDEADVTSYVEQLRASTMLSQVTIRAIVLKTSQAISAKSTPSPDGSSDNPAKYVEFTLMVNIKESES